MATRKETPTTLAPVEREPFGLLRRMTAELEHVFDEPFFRGFEWPREFFARTAGWTPAIDVFEKDKCLVTRIDLPGMKKEDVKVELSDGHLAISGERKTEKEEKTENEYRRERSFGSFNRIVPLPKGVKFEDVKATFADGVLEVTVPMPAAVEPAAKRVEIEAPAAAA
jgi:HSP20 family protein